jgi:hypothetical protein
MESPVGAMDLSFSCSLYHLQEPEGISAQLIGPRHCKTAKGAMSLIAAGTLYDWNFRVIYL